jgi:hypothetical protein
MIAKWREETVSIHILSLSFNRQDELLRAESPAREIRARRYY